MKKYLKSLAIAALSLWALVVTIPVTAQVYTAYSALDGSASAPSYAFNSSTNTGVYRLSLLNALAVAVNGVTGWAVDSVGHTRTMGAVPVLSICGTTSTITGTDQGGVIVNGGSVPATCTITFANAWLTIPSCTFNDITTVAITQGATYKLATSKTAMVITLVGAPTAGDTFTYSCAPTS